MPTQSEAFFMPASPGPGAGVSQRFCLFHRAQSNGHGDGPRGRVLYIHPFAEEMNKSRRMAALQARALADAGFDVLQIDLLGCGDSSGDFGDATWQLWISDVLQGCAWLREQSRSRGADSGDAPLWLWGLRAGCLLAVDAAARLDEPCNFLFWQAPSFGKPLLHQFLRLKLAGDMLSSQGKGILNGTRQQLANGSPVEIAGYMLSPELASGLERAVLAPTARGHKGQRFECFELTTREGAGPSPVVSNLVAQWQQSGYGTGSHLLNGPAFWQTSEIEEAPELIAATTAAISESRAANSLEPVA